MLDPLYCGSPTLLERLQWISVGKKRVLVLKPSQGDESIIPAKVVIVGNIDRDQFCMSVEVVWHVMSDSLASRYAMAILEKPVHPLAHMTQNVSMDNLRRIKDLLPQG